MFERFTESARRIVFFARYEASSLGSGFIEPSHLLLALFREDRVLRSRLSSGTMQSIRQQIELTMLRMVPGISTSVVFLLLAKIPSGRSLSRRMRQKASVTNTLIHIISGSAYYASKIAPLRTFCGKPGITLESLRTGDLVNAPEGPPIVSFEAATPGAPSLVVLIGSLGTLVYGTEEPLNAFTETSGIQRLKRSSWSRKEALGHLIDYAIVHHTWVARALTEPKVAASGYPDDSWVSAQRYNSYPWLELVNSWLNLNHLMLHVWHGIPEGRIQIPCRIGVEEAVPLSELLAKYVEHCDDNMRQILARL